MHLKKEHGITMDTPDGTSRSAPSGGDPVGRIKESAASVIDHTKQVAGEKVEEGVERAAGSAQRAASALRRAAGDVEADNAWIGAALRKSADGIEQATRSLAGGDVSHGVSELNAFARRQPAIFLGASLALGFALARVGKTAIESSSDGADDASRAPNLGM